MDCLAQTVDRPPVHSLRSQSMDCISSPLKRKRTDREAMLRGPLTLLKRQETKLLSDWVQDTRAGDKATALNSLLGPSFGR